MTKARKLPAARLSRYAQLLKALGHPVRLKLFLDALDCLPLGTRHSHSEEEARTCQLAMAKELRLAPSTVSHHFKDLRSAGLLRVRRQGKRVAFWLDPKAVSELKALLGMLGLLLMLGCGGKGGGPQGGFAVKVVTSQAKQEDLLDTIPAVGTLAADEAVELLSETEGRVEEVGFQEGERVRKGRVLFRIDEAKLRAQAEQAAAKAALSESNHKRASEIYKEGVISPQEYEQARSRYEEDKAALAVARSALEDATVRAPFDGVVGARLVSPGQVVRKGDKLSSVIDPHPIKVEFQVPERYAGALKEGQRLRLSVASFEGEAFEGNSYFVSPAVDPATRTVLVKAKVPNPKLRLAPGMFANLELVLGVRKDAVTIPESALLRSGDSESVFVVDAASAAAARAVEVGLRLKGRVQVLSGVSAGERVVIEGVQKVFPGAALSFDPGG